MIITRLRGGLGNQLFQYAFGRALAERHQAILKLDIGLLNQAQTKWTYRMYGLEAFNIHAPVATTAEIRSLTGILPPYGWIASLGLRSQSYHKEPHFQFYPQALEWKPPLYLDGYWQSERYFEDIKTILRQELTLQQPLSATAQSWLDAIQSTQAVSVHIRRGDYATPSKANRYLRPCSLEYYQKSLTLMAQQVVNPTFWIFSDEINWAKKHLQLPYPTHFVEGNLTHEDLRLMAACRQHIIANSTFSWWGAWLNPSPQKIVIAPKDWFTGGTFYTADLLPATWLKI